MSLIGDAPFWEYFEEICSIPHGSGNTNEISEYLVNFAKEQGLKYVKDELNNVVIYKSATEGYENKPAVILQGHMDMVAVKTKDCVKDLEKDGLDLEINDEWLSAVGTSLGGDDGIAVAYMLAILASKDYKHPALECVITVDEEVGMDGAFGIKAEQLLKGTRMMNMDNEGEGVFLAGCAGGARIDCSIPVERKLRDAIVYELKVSGLKGGHSGVEINDNRVSAATIIARFLCELKLGRTRLIDIKCGEKDNVIANSGYIKFICSAPKPDVMEILDFYADVLKEELATREPGLKLEYECLGNEINVNALNRATSDKVMDFLLALPQGVDTMSADVPDLVETSDNIGIIDLTENELKCSVSVRSSYASAKQALCDKVIAVATLAGGTAKQLGDYPGWAYRVDSPLRDIMVEAYKEMYGNEPKVEAIHAGVECGLFIEKLEGLDCVSYGPDIEAIHSVNERLNIPSAERVYDFTVKVLERS